MSRSRFSRTLIFFLLILALSAVAFADTIRLKDGSRIKGKIISFKDNRFVVEMGSGSRRKELTFAAAEIESIQFDLPTGPPQFTPDSTGTRLTISRLFLLRNRKCRYRLRKKRFSNASIQTYQLRSR